MRPSFVPVKAFFTARQANQALPIRTLFVPVFVQPSRIGTARVTETFTDV
jgi:hypothetical protein